MDYELKRFIAENDVKRSKEAFAFMKKDGVPREDILNELIEGLNVVGERYREGEYFIADLIVSGMNVKDIIIELQPQTGDLNVINDKGTVVIGTIYEDIHDIGKDLVADSLKAYGFNVIDLGVDVTVSRFLESVDEYAPDILAVSCVMTSSFKYVIELCNEIKEKVNGKAPKIVVGGSEINERIKSVCDADFLTNSIFEGLNFIMDENGTPVL